MFAYDGKKLVELFLETEIRKQSVKVLKWINLTPKTDYEDIVCKYMTIWEQRERKAPMKVLYLHVYVISGNV